MCNLNSCCVAVADTDVHIHGWDSTGWFWHDVTDTTVEVHEAGAVLRKLRKGPVAFQGICRVPGSPECEFQTTAYDLTDAGLAIVHLDGAPVGALTVLPAHRRPRLRNEFAFGFVAHLSFLDGLIDPGFGTHDPRLRRCPVTNRADIHAGVHRGNRSRLLGYQHRALCIPGDAFGRDAEVVVREGREGGQAEGHKGLTKDKPSCRKTAIVQAVKKLRKTRCHLLLPWRERCHSNCGSARSRQRACTRFRRMCQRNGAHQDHGSADSSRGG